MNKTNVNWGVIGCAGIAKGAMIPGILSAENATLYAVASRGYTKRLEEFKEEFKPVKAYTSYEELLEDPEIDAVYIPLPNGLHCEWAIKALEKKKHVLCEKPLGATVQEVQMMQQAADENGVLLMEAFAYRQSPLTKKVKSLLEEGAIGKLKYIESNFSFFMENKEDVRFNKKMAGGATYDVGCYNLNLIRYIAGSEPTAIYATGEIEQTSDVDESSCIMLEFEGGLKAVSYCAFNSAERSEYIIVGESGVIHVPVQFNTKGDTTIILTRQSEKEEITIFCPNNYTLEVEQFGRSIQKEESPLITYEDSLQNAKVIDEALRQIFDKRSPKADV